MTRHDLPVGELAGPRPVPALEVAGWVVFAAYLVLVIGFAWNPTPLAQGLAAIGIAAACAHAVLFYGWRDAAALIAICLITTFAMEIWGPSPAFRSAITILWSGQTWCMSESSRSSSVRCGSGWDISRGSWQG